MASIARTPPPKRSHAREGDADESPNGSGTSAKRVRRSRWENDDDGAPDAPKPAETTPPSAKGALSEIIKRLSSVVKEKSAQVAPQASPVDAAAARARALAQASLLAMGLPVGQVSQSDLAKRVYVGNLYYDLKEDDVRSYFGPFGTISSVDLSMEPGMTRSKGFCFIEYDDVLAAESAVQVLNGTVLSNRTLKVGRPHRGNSSDPNSAQNIGKEAIKNVPTKCVYVGGVRVELNSHHLQSIFSPFGDIRACVMTAVSPLDSTMHRGYGFLEFADETSASNAIQHMNGFELAGQKLKVGKASASAMLINLAISQDKVLAGGSSSSDAPKPHAAVVEDPDVDGVADPVVEDERRCLCLLNMVNKGEVDDELADEVRDECSRFGAVERVDVQELSDHVRVFVAFAQPAGALAAQRAMHGRFFGGNQVRAAFYPLAQLAQQRYQAAFLP